MNRREFLARTLALGLAPLIPLPAVQQSIFCKPSRFIGKTYELEPTLMKVDAKTYMVEFFAYETLGGSIGAIPCRDAVL
jgi:hypothetical protein